MIVFNFSFEFKKKKITHGSKSTNRTDTQILIRIASRSKCLCEEDRRHCSHRNLQVCPWNEEDTPINGYTITKSTSLQNYYQDQMLITFDLCAIKNSYCIYYLSFNPLHSVMHHNFA